MGRTLLSTSGRQDLNLRPLGPRPECAAGTPPLPQWLFLIESGFRQTVEEGAAAGRAREVAGTGQER